MFIRFSLFIMILIQFSACKEQQVKQSVLSEDFTAIVFKQGDDGYQCYRIPAIIKCDNDNLLAFAEARKNGCSDTGNIDLVMKRSEDKGKTWSDLQIIWDDSLNVCGNPAPVLDSKTGKIHLLLTWNLGEDHESEIIAQTSTDTRRVYVLSSDDNGLNWTTPKEITNSTKETNWTWYATGPGSGMQVSQGKYEDRMMIACDHIEAETKKYYSHIIYSDDSGASWNLGGTTPNDQVNECEIAELSDGRLLLNMRNYDREQKFRQTVVSVDGGKTWSDQKHDKALIEPICQASLQSISFDDKHALAFSNPASQDARTNMTLRISTDDGKSWKYDHKFSDNPAAYSDLVQLENGDIGCLFETGVKSPYEQIVFTSISL